MKQRRQQDQITIDQQELSMYLLARIEEIVREEVDRAISEVEACHRPTKFDLWKMQQQQKRRRR